MTNKKLTICDYIDSEIEKQTIEGVFLHITSDAVLFLKKQILDSNISLYINISDCTHYKGYEIKVINKNKTPLINAGDIHISLFHFILWKMKEEK